MGFALRFYNAGPNSLLSVPNQKVPSINLGNKERNYSSFKGGVQLACNEKNWMVKVHQVSANFDRCIFASNQMQKIENGIKGGFSVFIRLFCGYLISLFYRSIITLSLLWLSLLQEDLCLHIFLWRAVK